MTAFTELSHRFPTFKALSEYLRSPEGGKLIVRDNHPHFAVIHYDKQKSDMSHPLAPLFRSVIWNVTTNRPILASPVRGQQLPADFHDATLQFATTDNCGDNTVRVEEFIDGTMINAFFAEGRWQLATRTQLGATNNFYGQRSFADLFWETFETVGLSMDPEHVYSWVLQHPDERIVVSPPYNIPRLSLVSTSDPALPENLKKIQPRRYYDLQTLQQVHDRLLAWGKKFGSQWQGVIVWMPDGTRYKARSAEYSAARQLRGNQAKRAYTWLERWTEGKISSYLRLFPEESNDANVVIQRYKDCTQEMYDLYEKVYRKKQLPLGQVQQKYRKLLWELHQANAGAYFPSLRTFMNKQDIPRKLWLVNYEIRYGVTEVEAGGAE